MKIIQLASFSGNVGDSANIDGTRRMLRQNFGGDIAFTDLEFEWFGSDPRWRRRNFDQSFIAEVNRHDLFLIGGGGFFGLTTDKTLTGAPINIPIEILRQIKIPTVFYALGFHAMDWPIPSRVQKFQSYLDAILSMNHVLVSVRNDGSMDNLRKVYGDSYSSKIFICPDGGFFSETENVPLVKLSEEKKIIALQLAGDKLEKRFLNNPSLRQKLFRAGRRRLHTLFHGGASEECFAPCTQFIRRLAGVFTILLDQYENVRVVLVPHIPADYTLIDLFLKHIGCFHARNNITVAPYILGQEAQSYLLNLYDRCALVVGMRFHANVCPIGRAVPSLGLVTYPQINALYQILNIPERAIMWNDSHFEERLTKSINESLKCPDVIRKRYGEIKIELQLELDAFHRVIMDKFFRLS